MKYVILSFLSSLGALSLMGSYTYGTSLYHLEASAVEDSLYELNQNYRMNMDIIVLDGSSVCSSSNSMVSCLSSNYDDSVDLMFMVDTQERTMEHYVLEEISDIIDEDDLLTLEQQLVSSLQNNDLEDALVTHINNLETYIQSRCDLYDASSCFVSDILVAQASYEHEQDTERLRETNSLLWYGVWIV